jgi:molybdopterin converting factor subunit 1
VNVHVRYFAGAREAAGREAETLALDAGSVVADVLRLAVGRHPALAELADSLRFALGEAFVAPEAPLYDEALVAFIPPVGGG